MRDIGLHANHLSEIINIFKKAPTITAAAVFGSRAKDIFLPYSDVDIAVYGDCDILDIEEVMCNLDDMPTAYTFDVVAYNSIRNPALRRHIDRVGVMIYTKTEGLTDDEEDRGGGE